MTATGIGTPVTHIEYSGLKVTFTREEMKQIVEALDLREPGSPGHPLERLVDVFNQVLANDTTYIMEQVV